MPGGVGGRKQGHTPLLPPTPLARCGSVGLHDPPPSPSPRLGAAIRTLQNPNRPLQCSQNFQHTNLLKTKNSSIYDPRPAQFNLQKKEGQFSKSNDRATTWRHQREKGSPSSATCGDQRPHSKKEQHQRCGGSNAVSIPPIRGHTRVSVADSPCLARSKKLHGAFTSQGHQPRPFF